MRTKSQSYSIIKYINYYDVVIISIHICEKIFKIKIISINAFSIKRTLYIYIHTII
jgi:hypothetical protein